MKTVTVSAQELCIGDEFFSENENVWFKVLKTESSAHLLDILCEVVSGNPDEDYLVGDSYWINFIPEEQILTRVQDTLQDG